MDVRTFSSCVFVKGAGCLYLVEGGKGLLDELQHVRFYLFEQTN
jgi:hypothetical protein